MYLHKQCVHLHVDMLSPFNIYIYLHVCVWDSDGCIYNELIIPPPKTSNQITLFPRTVYQVKQHPHDPYCKLGNITSFLLWFFGKIFSGLFHSPSSLCLPSSLQTSHFYLTLYLPFLHLENHGFEKNMTRTKFSMLFQFIAKKHGNMVQTPYCFSFNHGNVALSGLCWLVWNLIIEFTLWNQYYLVKHTSYKLHIVACLTICSICLLERMHRLHSFTTNSQISEVCNNHKLILTAFAAYAAIQSAYIRNDFWLKNRQNHQESKVMHIGGWYLNAVILSSHIKMAHLLKWSIKFYLTE